MKLSFIIVNYKSREYLNRCVASIFKNVRGVDFEIIVVNNDEESISKNSFFIPFSLSSGSLKREQFFEKVKVVEVSKNKGFGSSCNNGVKKAGGEILCFLNPDTEILSDNIKELLSEFIESVGVVGPKVIDESGEMQKWSVGKNIDLIEVLKNNFGFSESKKVWESDKKMEPDWVTGATMLIRKNLFLKLGGFDEKFFLYFEDIDLCKRAQKAGKSIIYFPKFKVKHIGGKSSRNKKEQKKEYYKSQDYYFEKWYGKKTSWLLGFLRKFHF